MGGGRGLDVVGVALGDDTAGGAQGDGRLAQVLDGGVGSHAVERRHGIFGGEGLVSQLAEQHLDSALGAALLVEEVDANALVHVAILNGGAQLLTLHDLHRELRHGGRGLAHTGGGVGGGNDQNAVFKIGAGVLLIHTGEDLDAQLVLNSLADGGAGVAVTAGVERGTGKEQVGILGLDPLEDLRLGFLLVLGKVGVAAHDRLGDLSFALPGLLERETGTDDAVAQLGSDMSHLFAADVGKELVDIMNNFKTHLLFPPFLAYRALRQLKPISLVAPVMTCSSASMEPSSRREPA